MSEEATTPAAPAAPAERPDRPDRSERPSSDRGPRPGGDRGGDRGSRGNWSVKAKLRARARKKARKARKGMFQRRKVCRYCADKKLVLSYKDPKTLRLFISETGKITPRRISGTCAKHQRRLAVAIKRARQIALLPIAANHF